MNKNWLYRLLALALVAMLAIPMFALAEEEAFDLSAAEGVAVEEKKDAEYVDVVLDPDNGIVIDLDSAYNYDAEADICLSGVYLVDANGDRLSFSKVKTSNSKIATVSKNGKINLKKTGDVTLTVTGENSEGENEQVKIRLTVTDYYKVDKIKAQIASELEGTVTKDGSFTRTYPQGSTDTLTIDITPCASGLDDDEVEKAYGGEVSLKSSNTKIAKVTKDSYNSYTVKVDGSKTGTAKLTFASKQKGSNKKWVMTIKIAANKSKTTSKTQVNLMQEAAEDAEDVLMGVRKIAYAGQKKMKVDGETVKKNKWDVTVYVCNGTGRKIKKVKDLSISIVAESLADENYSVDLGTKTWSGKKTVNWKKGVSDFKFTIETDEEDDIPNFTKESIKAKVAEASFTEDIKGATPIIIKGEE